MGNSRITVFGLLYGDHEALARRCLESIWPHLGPDEELRLGLNEVCAGTRRYLLARRGLGRPQDVYDYGINVHKYPLMRKMFYDPENPITSEFVMWFDDDSYVTTAGDFFSLCRLQIGGMGMLGSPYTYNLHPRQPAWIAQQPWFRGKPLLKRGSGRNYVQFLTGGWWMARTEVLQAIDYPWSMLDHRGGDHLLGECLRQNDIRTGKIKSGLVAINADEHGRESTTKTRGFKQLPLGADPAAVAPVISVSRVPFTL